MTRSVPILAVLGVLGCGESPSVSVGTFNAGLAPGQVPLTDERVGPVAEAIAAALPDILCLQEIWRTDDLDELVPAGYERIRLPDVAEAPGCVAGELAPVADCAGTACAGACGTDLLECSLDACDALTLSSGCISCAIDAAGCVEDIVAGCESGAGSAYLFPSYDTALLSRLPVVATNTRVLDSTLVRSAVLHARVAADLGEVDVFCAHFASPIATFDYDGPHGSWQGERAVQVEQTIAFIREIAGDGPAVLLGDLNADPGSIEVQRLRDLLGLEDLASEVPCTLCTANSFRSAESAEGRVDHLLGRGLSPLTVGLGFEQEVALPDGRRTNLSDHYGVHAILEAR